MIVRVFVALGFVGTFVFAPSSHAVETKPDRICRLAQVDPDPVVRLENLEKAAAMFDQKSITPDRFRGVLQYLLQDSHFVVFVSAMDQVTKHFLSKGAEHMALSVMSMAPFRGYDRGDALDDEELNLRRQYLLEIIFEDQNLQSIRELKKILSSIYSEHVSVTGGLILKIAELCSRVSGDDDAMKPLETFCVQEVAPLFGRIAGVASRKGDQDWAALATIADFAMKRTRGEPAEDDESSFPEMIEFYRSERLPEIMENTIHLVLVRNLVPLLREHSPDTLKTVPVPHPRAKPAKKKPIPNDWM